MATRLTFAVLCRRLSRIILSNSVVEKKINAVKDWWLIHAILWGIWQNLLHYTHIHTHIHTHAHPTNPTNPTDGTRDIPNNGIRLYICGKKKFTPNISWHIWSFVVIWHLSLSNGFGYTTNNGITVYLIWNKSKLSQKFARTWEYLCGISKWEYILARIFCKKSVCSDGITLQEVCILFIPFSLELHFPRGKSLGNYLFNSLFHGVNIE